MTTTALTTATALATALAIALATALAIALAIAIAGCQSLSSTAATAAAAAVAITATTIARLCFSRHWLIVVLFLLSAFVIAPHHATVEALAAPPIFIHRRHRHHRRCCRCCRTATAAAATTIVELIIVHCQRMREQQNHHQHTNGSTNVKMFTIPDNMDLFNLSTVFLKCLFGRRQRRERARGLTDKNLNSGLRFKCGEEKLRLEVSFSPRFSIASDEQPVHATELESSSKSTLFDCIGRATSPRDRIRE
jgi:hypothetical protein